MINSNKQQKGQALVLIALGIVALVAITALAIDGGNAFSERRQAQNAADTAALAGALEKIQDYPTSDGDIYNFNTAALNLAALNNFNNNGTTNTVVVHNPPVAGCNGVVGPYVGNNEYIQVIINNSVTTFFAQVVGITQTQSCVEAVARAKTSSRGPLFFGNTVVGLDPNGTSFQAQSNAQHWTIKGGGIFANNNALDKHSNVTFPDGDCVTAVGTVSGFPCGGSGGNADLKFAFPDDIIPLLPPIPPCSGTAYKGADNKFHEQSGHEGLGSTLPGSFSLDDYPFSPGLYCITSANAGNIHDTVTGSEVTFFVNDDNFSIKFNCGGAFSVQAPTTGIYKGVLMFSNITPSSYYSPPTCSQSFEIRGNGSTPIVGTIFMPSACIDWRGNGDGLADRSQLIGFQVSSNGNANVDITYDANDQFNVNIPAIIELTQ